MMICAKIQSATKYLWVKINEHFVMYELQSFFYKQLIAKHSALPKRRVGHIWHLSRDYRRYWVAF